MPRRDGTGPYGEGPWTGGGFGSFGHAHRHMQHGYWGRGYGQRRCGCCAGAAAELTKEEEGKILRANIKDLEDEKAGIEKRLRELEEGRE